jgi:hypothetical protein
MPRVFYSQQTNLFEKKIFDFLLGGSSHLYFDVRKKSGVGMVYRGDEHGGE